ncbi:peptide ABC transporter substrate-binding protein [Bifidobacterium leontopitheci]|uniref:ABC transporter substrate-binding protein n=1 Tax=Bifidobacterium leontopitheci TaxID=2650774 RepID=A0A6I1GR68_9BIFI|nr:ABC transporter substrate-binding protein [Bifidobacterium leontopitheci]KAB7790628.1 ABC transporter substrate-binding protein [Bifidobacterium leontopitheci]
MKKKYGTALLAAGAAIVMLLSGCGTSSTSGSGTEAGSNIISVYGSEPAHPLFPGNTTEAGGGKVVDQLFAGLVTYGSDGSIHNEVAQSITSSDNATHYVIKIKKGWKFTDGTPVTAHSFVDAWNYTANSANKQASASFFNTIEGYDALQAADVDPKATLSGLSTPDDYTIDVKLSQSDSAFPVKSGSHAYMPLPESAFKDPKKFGENPVSNGPYKFKSWTHNRSIEMVKNPDYKGNRVAKNDGLTFKIYTSPDSAYADLKGGNLDFTNAIPATQLSTFQNDSSIKAYNQPGGNTLTFTIPESLEHFGQNEEGNLRRQALSMAINRKTIAEKIFNGTSTPAVDFLAKPISGYSDSLKGNEVLTYNAAKAKELWAKADAISKFSGEFKIAYNADGDAKNWVEAVCNSIKNTLGITAKGAAMATSSEFLADVDAGKMTTAYRSGWGPDYPSADNYLIQLYASSAADGKGANTGSYKNPKFDALMDKALSASSIDEANKYYQQGEEILLQDLPAIPLWNQNATAASTPNVSGVEFDYGGGPVFTALTKK